MKIDLGSQIDIKDLEDPRIDGECVIGTIQNKRVLLHYVDTEKTRGKVMALSETFKLLDHGA